MRFLLDAQLPRRLARAPTDAGHDAIHTLDLPEENRTGDSTIDMIADRDGRVVVSKDSDVRDSHLLRCTPRRLLRVTAGNLSNRQLLELFDRHVPAIETALDDADVVEISLAGLTIHPRR